MDKRLTKIKNLLKDLDPVVFDTTDFEMIEIPWEINFSVDEDKLTVSFFSNIGPNTSAIWVKWLTDNGIKDFVICENIYPKLDENDELVDLLFGDEADVEYAACLYQDMKKKIEFMKMPVEGMKH